MNWIFYKAIKKAKDFLSNEGYDKKCGARPLKNHTKICGRPDC